MFDSADLDHKADKARWQREEPALREALLAAQYALSQQGRHAVLIIIAGVEGAGKGETLHLLNEWMDPRHIRAYAFGERGDEEAEQPPMWRFWRVLPPRGSIGILFGSWYTQPILQRVNGADGRQAFDGQLAAIRRHEQMLADEGVLLLKFWFHLSKKQQKRRLERLESDPDTRWRVTREDWRRFARYDRFRDVSADALRATDSGQAPWLVVPGSDHRYRSLLVGKALLEALRARLALPDTSPARTVPVLPALAVDSTLLLDRLDLGLKLSRRRYERQLEKLQGELNRLSRSRRFVGRSLVAVFEGWDAAGKGSTIRRVAAALDARHYKITPVAAPTQEELAQPYLWRFWRQLPRRGNVAIFDRSWYGRVLVERVEGYCAPADWMRAYSEINDFEQQLVDNGAVVAKFWMHISADEQHRRFKERENTPFKRYKLTEDDWRNRSKREAYCLAVCEMVDRCSSVFAPWTLVEAEDKYFARIKVLRTLVEQIEAAL